MEKRLDLRAAVLVLFAVLAAGAGCATRRPTTSAVRTLDTADEGANMCVAFACEP